MKDVSKNIAFAKGTPTVFIVVSPLQLLCAIELEKELEINDHKYIIVLRPNWPRNEQLLAMAKSFELDFDEVQQDDVSFEDMKRGKGFFSDRDAQSKYGRIFLGDYHDPLLYQIAYKYAANGSFMIYGDDGNAAISLFQCKSDVPIPTTLRKKLHWYRHGKNRKVENIKPYVYFLRERGIICSNCFFTMFNDIRSRKFEFYPNNFENLQKLAKAQSKGGKVVLVVGPFFKKSYELSYLSEEYLEAIFWVKLTQLSKEYKNDAEIWYIPHGRDENMNIPVFCKQLGIDYKKIPEAVEWFVLKTHIEPIAIYGQISTALYSLKKLYPQAKVVNWFIDKKYDNPFYVVEKRKTKYYSMHGIIEDQIPFPTSFKEKWHYWMQEVRSVLEWSIDMINRKKP